MTIAELLSASGLPNLESELLAAFALRQERTWVIAHASDDLTSENIERCQGLFNRRRNGEPLAYITGTKEFYGREFRVTPAVLIPRQSTEILIDQALSFNRHPENSTVEADSGISIMSRMFHDFQQPSIVVDIGTGSGIIAITLALERPDLSLIATDISGAALRVARQNAADFGVINRIDFRKGSMLDPLNDLDEPFLIFANPPYIPASRVLSTEVKNFEPNDALFAGSDGTDVLRALCEGAKRHPLCCGMILECETDQVPMLDRLLSTDNS